MEVLRPLFFKTNTLNIKYLEIHSIEYEKV